jgi:hypothetical protein
LRYLRGRRGGFGQRLVELKLLFNAVLDLLFVGSSETGPETSAPCEADVVLFVLFEVVESMSVFLVRFVAFGRGIATC